MNKFEILSQILEYIEENITEDISPEDCAKKCGYSLSNMQKMFRCVFHIGISDYISRRRLTAAAKELIGSDASILDIALKYGYNSHETFTRAFVRLWGITPSKYRRTRNFSGIFPKLEQPRQVFDERRNLIVTSKKFFDQTDLYDLIMERRGKFAVCFDMVHLMYINDTFGHSAGDMAIAECLRRIDQAAEDDMFLMRIGGDEFVLITNLDDISNAEEIAEKILAFNENTVRWGENDIPVSMQAGYVRIPEKGNIRYNDLFDSFMIASRKN